MIPFKRRSGDKIYAFPLPEEVPFKICTVFTQAKVPFNTKPVRIMGKQNRNLNVPRFFHEAFARIPGQHFKRRETEKIAGGKTKGRQNERRKQ
jgi:hypothetical protein